MPVQLADTARLQVHADPGDLVRDREVSLCALAGPAAALMAPGRDVNEDQKSGWVLMSVPGAVTALGLALQSCRSEADSSVYTQFT